MAVRKDKKVTENPLYHDTWKLLKKYRDVVWSLELSVQQVKNKFQISTLRVAPNPKNHKRIVGM